MHGFVAEGPGENLFVIKDGELHEPEPTSALPGITRDTVYMLARDRGAVVHTRRLTRDDVYLADEAFFCRRAAEITAIIELDRRRIGAGEPGAVTLKANGLFRRRRARYAAWLTPALTPRHGPLSD